MLLRLPSPILSYLNLSTPYYWSFTPLPFFEMEANKTVIFLKLTQPEFTCSKLAIEAPKQGMKYVES